MLVQDILKKLDYTVKVFKMFDQNGCYVEYPKILLYNTDKITKWKASYIISKNSILHLLELNDTVKDYALHIPDYAQRTFVELDVWRGCCLIQYNTKYVEYNGEDSVGAMIEIENNEEEKCFNDFFNEALQDSFNEKYDTIADELGFTQGYLACKNLVV